MTATNYAVAPGEYLEEWIDDHDLSQQRVAELLGSSRKQVNERGIVKSCGLVD